MNGIYVIGRAERMGLGTMTEEFCAAMRPDKVIIIDRDNPGRPVDASKIANSVVVKWRWRPPYETPIPQLHKELEGAKIVVGFETFYDRSVVEICRQRGAKTVMFPMWEWSPADVYESDVLMCLSQTDKITAIQQTAMGTRLGDIRVCDWPASPFINSICEDCQGAITHYTMICPSCNGTGFHRKINWPPRTFVHLAGNASHNREGTREVLQAASYLKGTGARLRVHSSFTVQWPRDPDSPIDFVGSVANRSDLLKDCDCLVQPRRLPGHSLPINEATGEGIPCIVLDLPDWKQYPYRVKAVEDGLFKAARHEKVWKADMYDLGCRMRGLAVEGRWVYDPGEAIVDCDHVVARPDQLPEKQPLPSPKLPTWYEFREQWKEWMK